MFEVGDRVEVLKGYCNAEVGMTGEIVGDDGDNLWPIRFDEHMGGHDCRGRCKSGYGQNVWTKNLKLIKKGKDMEIKVGQVWESTYGSRQGRQITVYKVTDGTYGIKYRFLDNDEADSNSIDYFIDTFKLITKGEVKTMEKKIKINTIGLKLKMGVETDNGVKGNIYSMSPQIVVVEDENGKHHSCEADNVKILYSVPEEAVNPKTKIMTKAEAKRLWQRLRRCWLRNNLDGVV